MMCIDFESVAHSHKLHEQYLSFIHISGPAFLCPFCFHVLHAYGIDKSLDLFNKFTLNYIVATTS